MWAKRAPDHSDCDITEEDHSDLMDGLTDEFDDNDDDVEDDFEDYVDDDDDDDHDDETIHQDTPALDLRTTIVDPSGIIYHSGEQIVEHDGNNTPVLTFLVPRPELTWRITSSQLIDTLADLGLHLTAEQQFCQLELLVHGAEGALKTLVFRQLDRRPKPASSPPVHATFFVYSTWQATRCRQLNVLMFRWSLNRLCDHLWRWFRLLTRCSPRLADGVGLNLHLTDADGQQTADDTRMDVSEAVG